MVKVLPGVSWELPAVNPVDGRLRPVRVSEQRVNRAVELGGIAVTEMLRHVPVVLRSPRAIFEDPATNGLLYVGVPEFTFGTSGDAISYWHGNGNQAYLVFVTFDKFACDWCWGERGEGWYPVGWIRQYSRKVI